jgi:hypothetical protein
MSKPTNYVGKSLTIKKGSYVTSSGKLTRIVKAPTIVTILAQEPAKNGKTRVFWKSMGYKVATLIK